MKALIALLVIALLVGGAIWLGTRDTGRDKDDDEKGAIDTTVDYLTGNTAVKAKFKAQRTTIEISIRNSVSLFEGQKGRTPNSLDELVTAGYLDKQYLNDEYGKPLESALTNGALVVRSYLVDKETGQRSLNWEKRF
jgi:hypothetical protein